MEDYRTASPLVVFTEAHVPLDKQTYLLPRVALVHHSLNKVLVLLLFVFAALFAERDDWD